jgi:hypothetical protein
MDKLQEINYLKEVVKEKDHLINTILNVSTEALEEYVKSHAGPTEAYKKAVAALTALWKIQGFQSVQTQSNK